MKLELCFHPILIKLETTFGITIIFHMENQFEHFVISILFIFIFINIGSQLSNTSTQICYFSALYVLLLL